jgi:regulator of protease activity HflC (stomatin/prohibitin superfamily)
MEGGLFVIVLLAIITLVILAKTAIVVPQQSAYVVERLGRFNGVLDAGFHILVPSSATATRSRKWPSTSRRKSASRATTCRCR